MKVKFYKFKSLFVRVILVICVITLAHSVKVKAEFHQKITNGDKLESVLKKIELKYNISFVYDASEINKNQILNFTSTGLSLDAELKQLSKSGITYKLVGDKVILKKAEVKAVLVKGTVVSKTFDGSTTEPLPGVYVSEKGTANGTTTGLNGEFQLNVAENATLVFSFIGYKTQEVALNGKTTLTITMSEDVSKLKEVVVTGYQNIDKRIFTGAAVSIKADEIKQDGLTDVSRMLEGRVAGVSVQTVSGTFGAAPKIRVRGATSITGENKPLYVVDGVVLEDVVNISNDQLSSGDPNTLIGSAVAGINADDIESFNILKDASATALYGARAMNGVVVITTKKGKIGKPTINYTGNYSSFLKPSYDNYNILNSADQMSVFSELARKGALNGSIVNRINSGVYGKLYKSLDFDPVSGHFPVENTPEARAAFLTRYARANTDWFDILFKNSFVQEHTINISSGTDKSQNYFSTSYYDDNGWTVADKVKRYTMKFRNNYQLSPKISVGVIADGALRRQKAPGTQGRTSNVVEGKYNRDFDINPFSYALNTSRTITAFDENGNREYFTRNFAPFNILTELENNYIDLNILDAKLQGELGYKINKSFEFRTIGAMRYVKSTNETQITEYSNQANAYRSSPNSTINGLNNFLYKDPDDPTQTERVIALPQGGFYNRSDDNLLNFYIRNQLSYRYESDNSQHHNTTNKKYHHIVNAFAGQEIKFSDRQSSFANGYGYQYDKGGVPFTDYRIIKQLLEGNFNYYGLDKFYERYASFFANASYSLNEKYIVNATVRTDGSNKLGSSPKARWLPTYTFSGAWNVEQEKFMQNIQQISYLKLRGSYGLTASIGRATNSSVVLQNSSALRPRLSEVESRIVLANLENSELTWEKQFEKNVGIDLGLFDSRLTLSADYYRRNGFDLISTIRTSGIGGESIKDANYADLKTRGFEFNIGATILKGNTRGGDALKQNPKLSWNTNLTFGFNKNEITNLKSQPRIYDLIIPEGGAKLGGPIRGLYSIDFEALDKLGIPLFTDEDGDITNNVYVQSTTTNFLKYEGSVDPTITGGLNNAFNYGNFSLNVFVSYQAGNKIRLNNVFKANYDDTDAMPREFLDRWTLPLDNQYTNTPSIADYLTKSFLSGSYPYTAYNYSTTRVADGSFVRLKTVSLNYKLTDKTAKSIGLNRASVGVVGNNLMLLYADKKLKGQDPEFFTSGGVALPVPRQITLSLKVGI